MTLDCDGNWLLYNLILLISIVFNRSPVDLIPLPSQSRVSESAQSLAKHIRSLHDSIRHQIEINNENYRSAANLHRRFHEFQEGDYVMIRVRPERFPSGAVKKLQARGAGPFKVLKRVRPNAYVIDLPADYGMSSTFNVSDLAVYRDLLVIPNDPFEPSPPLASDPTLECPLSASVSARREQIDRILDEQVITSPGGSCQRYLIRWKGRPSTEDAWITREELQLIDPDHLERYQSRMDPYSTGSSSFQVGRIGGDT